MTRSTAFWILLSAMCALLVACATPGETALAIGAGVAGAMTVVEQLFADGTISAEQAAALKGGFSELLALTNSLKQAAESGQNVELRAAGVTGAILAALRAWTALQGLRAKAKANTAVAQG